MRALVPIATCDHCEENIPVETGSIRVTFTLPNGVTDEYVGENCDSCADDLDNVVTEALREHLKLEKTRTPKGKARPTAVANAPTGDQAFRTCPVCNFVSKTRGALSQHLRHAHDTSLKEQGMSLQGGPGKKKRKS